MEGLPVGGPSFVEDQFISYNINLIRNFIMGFIISERKYCKINEV